MKSIHIDINIFFSEDSDLEKPTEEQVQEWAEFNLGISSSITTGNPMEEIDMVEDVDYSFIDSRID